MAIKETTTLRYRVEERSTALREKAYAAVTKVQDATLKTNQIRQLLRQADSGYGIAHICNWIRYQQGRVAAWNASALADVILQHIAELKDDAETIAKVLPGRMEDNLEVTWLALTHRYLAYLVRQYAVVRKQKGVPDEDEI